LIARRRPLVFDLRATGRGEIVGQSVQGRRTVGAWLRLALLALAAAYPLALIVVLAVLRGVGERWSLSTLALYLPRVGFGLPLPLLVVALVGARPRRWLVTQLLAALLLLFPLMGLELPVGRAARAGQPSLRIMSCNIDLGSASTDELSAAIRAAAPDVVCLQEARGDEVAPLARHLPEYVVRADGQFIVASKLPIVDVYHPPRIERGGEPVDPRFIRYRVETPAGLVDVYNVHPVSPHGSFDRLRGEGLLHELASGRFFVNRDGFRRLADNAARRERQVRALADAAARSPYPVLIAGDTNLPTASWIFGHYLGRYQDGFAEAGQGFGYTFPARHRPAWLRLDRILADERFRFVAFSRLDVHVSTHFPVVADVVRSP
jgi:endonuclease/exonuclease/phosphatase (EEP) superfamily protein YafD